MKPEAISEYGVQQSLMTETGSQGVDRLVEGTARCENEDRLGKHEITRMKEGRMLGTVGGKARSQKIATAFAYSPRRQHDARGL